MNARRRPAEQRDEHAAADGPVRSVSGRGIAGLIPSP
jgi:hypothetical protein